MLLAQRIVSFLKQTYGDLDVKSALVRIIGFPATLIHGDTLVLDRWLWLRRYLKAVPLGSKSLIDVGCGTGAFTIGVARMGYQSLGLSWDLRNQRVAKERARLCKADLASFEVQDVRSLGERDDLKGRFDVAICFECIEHILNDERLMKDMASCLKPGGMLLLTTPNFHFRPITPPDDGGFAPIENGGHVRRGYTPDDLKKISGLAGFEVENIEYCSGLFSQRITRFLRILYKHLPVLAGWSLTLPLRAVPPLLDSWVSPVMKWPGYSITLMARKRPPADTEIAAGEAIGRTFVPS
jgi:SAM-dependent methyltransferase